MLRESHSEKLARVLAEEVELVAYDPVWPRWFEEEKAHLRGAFPDLLAGRIEHFGSTAIPGMAAKPIVDMLVEIASLETARERIAPVLEAQGYDYFWRPTSGDDAPPFYAWFIKRNARGRRTHHIHIVEPDFPHWDRLLFRDYLIERPELAEAYRELKRRLAADHPGDRVAYTEGKTDFIARVTAEAKQRRENA